MKGPRDTAAVHADLRLYGAMAMDDAKWWEVWCYSKGRLFHIYRTTRCDSGPLA